jgi:hypothetical protein
MLPKNKNGIGQFLPDKQFSENRKIYKMPERGNGSGRVFPCRPETR